MVVDNRYLSSKLVSKEEASMANASCRVYYGEAAGAIPFMWESQPGTPKHPSSQSSLPPLTPPPSYSTTQPNPKRTHKITSKSKFLDTIFPRLRSSRKMLKPPPSLSSASSSSSSWSSSSSSSNYSSSSSASSLRNKGARKFYHKYEEDYDEHDHHESKSGSPTSALCFGGKRRSANMNGIRGCYSMKNIRFGFLSIVNYESGRVINNNA
ncbi:vitellogenin-A2 [Prunus avium]|uniref:Vitellogenin-A2 n=1 Tax=Prunus avium TaxID=42229 RepID=A0A6P5TCJ4_PRUAV|nr:vitellogenin-A2 [Prunus avium]